MEEILLIDDEPEIVVLTKQLLEKEGYKVMVAKNGFENFGEQPP
jgi:CheY-like chemotaxis protein